MGLLAFALSVRGGKSYPSIRETVTHFITIIWLITSAAIEILRRRCGSVPNSKRPSAPEQSWRQAKSWSHFGSPGSFLSSYYCFSGWYPQGPSFNSFRLQVCYLIWFGGTGEGAHLNTSGVAFTLDFSAGRIQADDLKSVPFLLLTCIRMHLFDRILLFSVRGAGSFLSAAEGRVATFFKTGTCS